MKIQPSKPVSIPAPPVPRPTVEQLATRSDAVRVIIDREKGSKLNIKA